MSANDYTVADYIEAGYFSSEGSPAAIGSGNDYVEDGYIDNTYFTQDTVSQGGAQEGSAFIVATVEILVSADVFRQAECLTNGQFDLAAPAVVYRDFDSAFALSTSLVASGNTTKDINLVAFDDVELTALGGALFEGSVVQVGEQDYVDGQYIDGNYFVGGIGIVPGITATLSADALKVVEATTNSGGGNDYIDPTYIEDGYFEGTGTTTTINVVFSLVGELTLDETGPISASATFGSISEIFFNIEVVREYDASVSSSFDAGVDVTKLISLESSITDEFQTSSDAERTRGVEAAFEEQISVTTINSRFRETNVAINSEFQQVTYANRARGIDIYAFSNGQLTADIVAIRDANLLANTFFDIGTDFIRQRDNGVEADAETSTSLLPIRIRDTDIETQDAFSFVPSAVKITDIEKDFVATSNIDDIIYNVTKETPAVFETAFEISLIPSLIRDNDSQQEVIVETSLTASVTRDITSDISSQLSIGASGNATLDCDMVAFDDAETTVIANAKFKAFSDMFSIPGFTLYMDTNSSRIRRIQQSYIMLARTSTNLTLVKGLKSEQNEIQSSVSALVGKINPLYSDMEASMSSEANGVVRFYFFPTDFSVNVTDEPLADTFFSRTRETGANI